MATQAHRFSPVTGSVRPLEVELELPATELGAEGDSVEELELDGVLVLGVLVLVGLGVPVDVLVVPLLPEDICLGLPWE
jgi:hypothetical protein